MWPSNLVPIRDASGNVIAIGQSNSPILLPTGRNVFEAFNNKNVYPFVDSTNSANYTDFNVGAVTGATLHTDTTVLFNGLPTTRIDIPAGAPSGSIRVGITGASWQPPANWDGSNVQIAIMTNNLAGVGQVASNIYIGDAALANYYIGNAGWNANYPERYYKANEWMYGQIYNPSQWVLKGSQGSPQRFTVGGGAPTFSDIAQGSRRIRSMHAYTSQAGAMSFWIGFLGIVAPRRPKIVLTFDDGYASWYSVLVPLAKYYGIPISLAIISGLIGAGNYLTAAQLQTLINDKSGLINVVPHATTHIPYNNTNVTNPGVSYGYTDYVADKVACVNYLLALGADPRCMVHHPTVQSISDDNLITAMSAAGFKSMRMGGAATGAYTYVSSAEQSIPFGDKMAMNFMGGSVMDATHQTTAAAVMANVNLAIALNETMFIAGHDFTGLGTTPPSWPTTELVSLFQQLSMLKDSGAADFYTWSDWYTSCTQ